MCSGILMYEFICNDIHVYIQYSVNLDTCQSLQTIKPQPKYSLSLTFKNVKCVVL